VSMQHLVLYKSDGRLTVLNKITSVIWLWINEFLLYSTNKKPAERQSLSGTTWVSYRQLNPVLTVTTACIIRDALDQSFPFAVNHSDSLSQLGVLSVGEMA